jgi:hypothetical protein
MSRKFMRPILAFLIALIVIGGMSVSPADLGPAVWAQGGVTGFASLRVSNFYRAAPRAAITLTNNATLNATGTFQQITAASAIGTSGANITVKPAGTILILLNTGSNTITFTETGTLRSAGNIALGALDSATLLSDGTNWTQIAASNN